MCLPYLIAFLAIGSSFAYSPLAQPRNGPNLVQDDRTFMSGYLYGPAPQKSALPGSFPTEQNCSVFEQSQVKKCAQPLYEIGVFRSDSTFAFTWQHFITRTKDYFSQVCDKFLIFDMCIDPYKATCFTKEPMRGRYQTAVKVLDFLCRDGYSEMTKNFECFTKTLTRVEMMQCQAEMLSDSRKIPEENGLSAHSEAKDSVVCGAMRNYMECIKYPIRYECGYRAWYIVREMIIRPTVAVLPECELTSGASTTQSALVFLLPLVYLLSLMY
ncbi:hypothetical protein QR680_017736 [Steinernema hermaphroditum]|uniref:DUF19 domain-containing protein n=1 Tax=Steinernema hermaphroditum TaxID=289476 RepID=A0AA39HHU4_9BILA|nr:hypothetical protein QR680_017736 [Steinernema hermaphroditum]